MSGTPAGDEGGAPRTSRTGGITLVALALVCFVGHMLFSTNYGYFRDELYYIAAGRHLGFGYVDFPPVTALIAALLDALTGSAPWAIHVVPALASALVVLLTGLIARELGGGTTAQALAAIASLVAATFMANGSIFSMDSLDQLWWTLAAFVLVRILKEDRPGLWPLFGLVVGVGLATKVTIALFGFAITVGLLLTPARRYFAGRWIWLGGAIALACLLPYALWNLANGWPTLEFYANYEGSEGSSDFLLGQLLGMNPLTIPLTLAGLVFYLRAEGGRTFRPLGWAFVVLIVVLAVFGAKAYFLSPAYPPLFAGGAVLIERFGGRAWRFARVAYAGLLLLSGVMLAPATMPVLPPATFANTYGAMSGAGNVSAGQRDEGVFPQYMGDRFGWEGMTETVAGVYDDLPAGERREACFFTSNYGEASAINFHGEEYGLPPALSGHNSYWLWGPGSCTGDVMITVGIPRGELEDGYARVERATTFRCRYCMPEQNQLPIYVASEREAPRRELWQEAKHYD